MWVALGAQYGSVLPFEFTGAQADALAQFRPSDCGSVNLTRGASVVILARRDGWRGSLEERQHHIALQGTCEHQQSPEPHRTSPGYFPATRLPRRAATPIRLQSSFEGTS